jgi:hypothetical protein
MANQNVTQLTAQTVSANSTSLFYAVINGTTDTSLPLSVLYNSPLFTGIPAAPTAAVNTNTTQIATTAYVVNQGYLTTTVAGTTYAPISNPTFVGTVVIPTVTAAGGTINGTSVGATTPSTGAFTTMSATGSVSGVGFSNYLASPPPIGGTSANAGTFSTLATTGLYSPSSTVGIKGTATNDNAQAGSIGEVISSSVVQGSAISLTTTIGANVTSISLTAGDWDVWGNVLFIAGGTTVTTYIGHGISTTTATLPVGGFALSPSLATGIVTSQGGATPMQRISIAATTTLFLVAQSQFTTSTMSAFGNITARRRR